MQAARGCCRCLSAASLPTAGGGVPFTSPAPREQGTALAEARFESRGAAVHHGSAHTCRLHGGVAGACRRRHFRRHWVKGGHLVRAQFSVVGGECNCAMLKQQMTHSNRSHLHFLVKHTPSFHRICLQQLGSAEPVWFEWCFVICCHTPTNTGSGSHVTPCERPKIGLQ